MFTFTYNCVICSISLVLQEMKDHSVVSHDWRNKKALHCSLWRSQMKREKLFEAGVSGVGRYNSVWRKEGATAAPFSPSIFFESWELSKKKIYQCCHCHIFCIYSFVGKKKYQKWQVSYLFWVFQQSFLFLLRTYIL